MKWHPDRHEGEANKAEAHRKFKEIGEAYRTLRDPTSRAEYDSLLAQMRSEQASTASRDQSAKRSSSDQRAEDANPRRAEEAQQQEDIDQALFFEQMIDLAFELMAKGFPEDKVAAALAGLGCPPSMARAVASAAAKNRKPGPTSAAKVPRARIPASMTELDALPWSEAEPLYRAALEGSAAPSPLSEADVQRISAGWSRRNWLCLFGLLVSLGVVLLAAFARERSATSNFLYATGAIVLGATVLVWLVSGLSYWFVPGRRAWMAEMRTQYYLKRFERAHGNPGGNHMMLGWNWPALVVSGFWLAYRKLFGEAAAYLAIYGIVGWFMVSQIALDGERATDRALQGLGLLLAIGVAMTANGLLFRRTRQTITKLSRQPTDQRTVSRLAQLGGPSTFAALGFFGLVVVVAIIHSAKATQLQEQAAAVEAQRIQAAEEARIAAEAQADARARELEAEQERQRVARNAEVTRRYQFAVAELERQHPWLNPDHPSFMSVETQWVVNRRDQYIERGVAPDEALRLAVGDRLRQVNTNLPGSTAVPKPTSSGGAVRSWGGTQGQSAEQVLCATFGACGR